MCDMKNYVAPSVQEIKLTAQEHITNSVDGYGNVGGRG